MMTQVDVDIVQVWHAYRAEPTVELRNQLVERYLPLVKYNAERIWSRLPDGVELDDLISAGVFGLMDAIDAFDVNRGRGQLSLNSPLRFARWAWSRATMLECIWLTRDSLRLSVAPISFIVISS